MNPKFTLVIIVNNQPRLTLSIAPTPRFLFALARVFLGFYLSLAEPHSPELPPANPPIEQQDQEPHPTELPQVNPPIEQQDQR